MRSAGIDVEFHVYQKVGHGFGLGIGTNAEGWLEDAVQFWENHTPRSPYTALRARMYNECSSKLRSNIQRRRDGEELLPEDCPKISIPCRSPAAPAIHPDGLW
jgi:hypothetical protein